MKDVKFTVRSNSVISLNTWKMVLEGDTSAISGSGQFVEISLPGFFLRRPISVNDADAGTLTLVYKVVGKGTDLMSTMKAGDTLDILTGLGNGFHPDATKEAALLLGGGVGTAPLYLLAKELISAGKAVTVVLGFNNAAEAMLVDDFKALGADVYIATMDGSLGSKGFVTDVVMNNDIRFDHYYGCGPLPMLKAVCAGIGGDGEISLEERMGCGCGICYGCTCHTTEGPKRVCADGPVFKKETIIW